MIDKSALFQQLIQVFLGELEEHVRTQNRDLLELEQSPPETVRAELLRNLLRSAHSVKGAAHAVGLPSIETHCHHVEELLGQVVAGKRPLDKPLFELLFASVDALDDAGQRLRGGHGLEGAPIVQVSSRLTQPPPPMPASAPVLEQPAAMTLPQARTLRPSIVPPPTSDRSRTANESASGFIRVSAQKLDKLLAQAGELTVASSHLDARAREIDSIVQTAATLRAEWLQIDRPVGKLLGDKQPHAVPLALRNAFERVRGLVQEIEREIDALSTSMQVTTRSCHAMVAAIDAEVKNVRMLPFADTCAGVARAVRDLAHERGKDVEVVTRGGDVELDRYILEGLKDPLIHLVRNAVDHGIEPPHVRKQAGKPERGRLEIAATLCGSQVEVTVTDDGAGLDIDAIVARAKENGFAVDASTADATQLIFLPGLTTSTELSLVSGRGVGLDVVKSRVESLHGQVNVDSKRGRGTHFALVVPLTVTTVRAVVVQSGGQVFALPSTSVERMVRLADVHVRWVEGRALFLHEESLVEIAPLSQILGLASSTSDHVDAHAYVVVVSGRGQTVGLVVDRLLFVDEILVRNLGRRFRRVRYISGGTVLAGAKVALILNVGEVVAALSMVRTARHWTLPQLEQVPNRPSPRCILVVDDSPTTRTLSKTILEAAGYEVIVAVDGQDAFRLIETRGVDLVLSDVEMPRMDGLALTQTIRASSAFAKLPVVLMTGLASERDKARGLEVGADAYLIKSAFDQQQLLEVISQLL